MKPLSVLVACVCVSVVGVALLFVPSSSSPVVILVGATFLLAGLIGYLFAEWKLLFAYSRVTTVSLSTVEFQYKRLPYRSEIIATPLLSIIVAALFFQYVSIVYAMSFSVSSSTSETNNTVDVVLADLDGDGDMDYIAGNSDSGAPSQNFDVYRNSGAATFTHVGTINGASTSFSKFAAGDIDGDGDADLVAAQAGAEYYLQTFLNNGSMTFTAGDSHSYAGSAAAVQDVLLVDVDNDGDLDIIPALSTALSSSAILLNNGHGMFTGSAAPMPAARDVIAADFNSDGFIDLAVHAGGATSVQFLQNSGTGSFTEVDSVTGLGGVVQSLAVADIDGDGDVDVLAPDSAAPAYIDILLNDGTGDFSENSPPSVYDYSIKDLATADFDNDGDIDFLDVGAEPFVGNGNELWLNNGNGTFAFGWQAAGGDTTSSSLAVGDLDGDGDLDYVLGRSGGTSNDVLLASGTANTAPTAVSSSTMTGAVTNLHLSTQSAAPTAASNDSSNGSIHPWISPSNAFQSDNTYTSVAGVPDGSSTQYLKVNDFGLSSLPAGSRVTGIKVTIEKACNCASSFAKDGAVRLIKGGVIGSTDRSDSAYWPTTDVVSTYGGPNDLWGTTWSSDDIVSSGFGVAFAASAVGNPIANARVDSIAITVYYTNGIADMTLSWGTGADTETNARLMQYQLRVGTGSNANNIVSGVTASPSWTNRVVPNGQSRRFVLKNLSCNTTYYWRVAALDTGFKSSWSSQKQLVLDSSCALGGNGGSAPPSTSGGGGGSVLFHQDGAKQEESSGGSQGILSVSLFRDTDQDGKKDGTENLLRLASLPVIITGRSLGGVRVERTERLDEQGMLSVTIEESDPLGYTIVIGSGADLHGNAVTSKLTYDHVVVRSGTPSEIAVGFRPIELLSYRPCLTVSPVLKEEGETDAEKLFSVLVDQYGRSIHRDLSPSGDLMLRGDFLLALLRTQCFPLAETTEQAEAGLRASELNIRAFADLPMQPYTEKTRAAYSALVTGLPVSRSSGKLAAADLSSPISRREAILLMKAVLESQKLPIPEGTGSVVPDENLQPHDPVIGPYLSLKQLGVLPEAFDVHLSPEFGMTKAEASTFLMRAAYASGKVGLKGQATPYAAAGEQRFMDLLPPLKARTCLESVASRAKTVSFSDVSPTSPLSWDLSSLLPFGTRNSDGVMLWLIPGTRRLTEFGITSGQQAFLPESPASVVDIVRALLIMSCMPPDVATTGKKVDLSASALPLSEVPSSRIAGTAESKVPRDRISDLPRDASLASRILYRSQDHRREYDLSLFSFAESFLMTETRTPKEPMTVSEASELFASTLFGMELMQGSLTPTQASDLSQDLSNAILQRLLGKDVDWRNEALGRNDPLTKAQLVLFLKDVLAPDASSDSDTGQGQTWYERIRVNID